MQTDQDATVGEQVVSGSLWMVGWRWTARMIGFITTIVLARLLVPEDFGLLATGMVVAGFFSIMIDMGTDSYLIRHQSPDNDDYDTAWTLRLLMMGAATVAIILAAQPGADFFGDERLVDVIRALALVGWLSALNNIGLVQYRREMNFRILALMGLTQRFSTALITIALAFWLQSYWAMVIGEICFAFIGVVFSYMFHSHRPRLTLARYSDQWDFSKWIMARNVAIFLQGQGDSFIVSKLFGIETMGIYSMGMRFAALPSRQLLAPVLMPVYSGLSKMQHSDTAFVNASLKVIGATCAVLLPAATIFAVLGESLIITLLGERWLPVVPIVAPLVLSMMLAMLLNPALTSLTVKGRVKLLAGLNWLGAISSIAVLLTVALLLGDLQIFAWSRVAVSLLLVLVYFGLLGWILRISVTSLTGSFARPLLASTLMGLALHALTLVTDTAWIELLLGVASGGISYVLVLAVLWRLAGSPDSGEVIVVQKLRVIMHRKAARNGSQVS